MHVKGTSIDFLHDIAIEIFPQSLNGFHINSICNKEEISAIISFIIHYLLSPFLTHLLR